MTQRDKYRPELELVEMKLLLEGVRQWHGIDLRGRPREWLRERIWGAMHREGLKSVTALLEKLLHQPEALERFLQGTPVSPEQAEAALLAGFRRDIVPLLRTYPFIRIWQAGCRSAFESYVLAIILVEEGVYEKSTIYNTEPDELSLRRIQDGLFPMSDTGAYERVYAGSGGRAPLARYFYRGNESGRFDARLSRNIVFAQHDFATDGSFNEFNAIFCRHPMRALNRRTRQRAASTLCESLVVFGVLGLCHGDSLAESAVTSRFKELDLELNLYRKIC